jgi:uncharacterized protein (TIGR00269 family)
MKKDKKENGTDTKCSLCSSKAVIHLAYAQRSLCEKHFIFNFEKRVKRTIRNYRLLKGASHIGVAVSGGKDSLAMLYILGKVAKPLRKKVTAILIDEGIKGYRDKTIADARKLCKELGVELRVFSYKDAIGISMDEVMANKNRDEISCTYCGVFRRWALNKAAKEVGVDKLAVGHNLDDTVQSYFMNIIRNEPFKLARFTPNGGLIDDEGFVPRIRPLFNIPEKEIALYAILRGLKVTFIGCPYVTEAFRPVIREFVNDLESKYPGSKFKILNNYLDTQDALEAKFRTKLKADGAQLNKCTSCGEPTSKQVCKRCQFLTQLSNNSTK